MNNKLFDMIQYGKEYRIFFVNGYQEVATILDRDDTKMLVKDQKGQNKLVYFHAVSTINL